MIGRLLLALSVAAPTVLLAADATAQSARDFLRQQQRRQEQEQEQQRRRPPPPPPAEPAAPAPSSGSQTAAPSAAAAPRNTGPAPYEKDMRRMGEILGALHYLRPLCGAADGQIWRDKMSQLIDAEGGPPDRRERFAGSFNESFNSFQLTYRTCTPSADLAIRRYLAEGAKLSREIATRHGN